jgi:hypothetical protein
MSLKDNLNRKKLLIEKLEFIIISYSSGVAIGKISYNISSNYSLKGLILFKITSDASLTLKFIISSISAILFLESTNYFKKHSILVNLKFSKKSSKSCRSPKS